MALGLVLWVAWISLLLESSVYTDAQPTSYRQTHDNINLVAVKDFSDGLTSDEGEGELSVKQSQVVNKEYKKSPVAQPLKVFSVDHNLANQHANLERIINGASRRWESNNLEPITFPLKSGSQIVEQVQPKPVYESQSQPLVHGNKRPVQSNHLTATPPNFEPWQLVLPNSVEVSEPVTGSLYQQQNPDLSGIDSTNAASPGLLGISDNDPFSYQGSNMVEFAPGNIPTQKQPSWQYPPAIPKPSQSESWHTGNEIDGSFDFNLPILDPLKGQVPSFYPSWHGFPYAWAHQPDASMSYKNYFAPRAQPLPAKAPNSPRALPPRQRFIVQSKNGYQRQRLVKSKTTYTPDYNKPKGKYGKSVKVSRGAVQNPLKSLKF